LKNFSSGRISSQNPAGSNWDSGLVLNRKLDYDKLNKGWRI